MRPRSSRLVPALLAVLAGAPGCGDDPQPEPSGVDGPEGEAPATAVSQEHEVPPPAAAPAAPRHPWQGLWEGIYDDRVVVVEILPGETGSGSLLVRAAAASQWRVERVEQDGPRLFFDLARGGLVEGKVVRFSGMLDSGTGTIRGRVVDGARSRELELRPKTD